MKVRELILWFLVIITIIMCLGNLFFNNQIFQIIKIIIEKQNYILELLDVRSGWMLL